MVEKCLQTEILLELVFSVSLEKNEHIILNKSMPLYLRKLNCFLAGVLKRGEDDSINELMVMPFAVGKSEDWDIVKNYFTSLSLEQRQNCPQFIHNNLYYYGLCLNGYGLFILGRKIEFDPFFLKELQNVVHHLGKILIQSNEIEKRQIAENKLIESEHRLSMLMQESPSDIEVYDANGLQVSVNKAYEKLWGISPSETLFRFNILECKAIKEAGLMKYVEKAYEGEPVSIYDYQFTPKNILSLDCESSERWLSTRIYPLKDQNDKLTHIVVNHEDVTHQKEFEKKILKAKEKAEESDRLKSAFLANMSHEIRTPMNGILGFTNLLKQQAFDEVDQSVYVELIEESGARMLATIDDLIDISKVESGQMELLISETDINKEIEYVYNVVKEEADSKNIQLHISSLLDSNESIIRTDRKKVYAVLRNLVKNAIKFSKKGDIEINVKKKGDYLEFFVKDMGIGVPEERQEAIFDRFTQADIGDKRAFEGTGLGLSITKAFVNMLGGEIWLKSKENIGSTFYFTLSCKLELDKVGRFKCERLNFELNQSKMNLKVLIVEDDKISRNFLELLVKPLSENIIIAKNGSEAVKIYEQNQDVNLILMDMKMPEMDGYEATRLIRQMNKDVIIIAQTAYSLIGDRDKSIEVGCNDYITKPIFKDKLMNLINKYFNHLVEDPTD
jgi:PAS domain S-box-containing protein